MRSLIALASQSSGDVFGMYTCSEKNLIVSVVLFHLLLVYIPCSFDNDTLLVQ